jgi:hypothetical protein
MVVSEEGRLRFSEKLVFYHRSFSSRRENIEQSGIFRE